MNEPPRAGEPRAGGGCGVQGCLFGAVALFVALLIALLVIAFFRFGEPPQGVGAAASHAAWLGSDHG